MKIPRPSPSGTSSAGTDTAGLRRHVGLARRGEPVHFAFALDADGNAILSMDRHRQPRVLEKALQTDAAGSRNHRSGIMTIDPEQPAIARLTVSRAASGMARKLAKALKGSGVKQVEVLLEDGTPVESAADEEAEPSDAPISGEAAGAEAAGADAATADTRRTSLEADLVGLVRQVMAAIAADPTRKAALAELATDARAALTRNDLDAAAAGLDVLRTALDDGGAPATPATAPAVGDGSADTHAHAAAQRYRKAQAAWLRTREKVDADIRKLQAAVLATDHGGAFGDDLEQQFLSAVDPILDTLDTSLSDMLAQAETAEGETAERMLALARGTVGTFRTFVARNDTIRHLDQNPFVPTAIGKTLQASLDVLATALR